MNKDRVMFWALTGAISSFMLYSAYFSGTHPVEFGQLGFPNFFRIELTVAKVVGAVMLLIPRVPGRVREWVYVGFGIVLVSAFLAKWNGGYPASSVAEPLFVLALLVGFAVWLDRLNRRQSTDVLLR